MLFWQFSNIIIYAKIVGKIPDQLLSVWLEEEVNTERKENIILLEDLTHFTMVWTNKSEHMYTQKNP